MTSQEAFDSNTKEMDILAEPANLECTCPKAQCQWHGKCQECVAIHRYQKDHIPACLQHFVNEKIKAIARIGQLDVVEKDQNSA